MVNNSIKKEGYLHKGMKNLVAALPKISLKKRYDTIKLVDAFFNDVSLCGPRIVDAPGNSERKLCELFVPYRHAMKSFYNLIKDLYYNGGCLAPEILSPLNIILNTILNFNYYVFYIIV